MAMQLFKIKTLEQERENVGGQFQAIPSIAAVNVQCVDWW